MKKLLVGGALALALAAPAFADTLKEVTTKGIVMTIQGTDIPIAYKPDGTFAVDVGGQSITGKWRIDGTKLCTSSNMAPQETCTEYPKDKKSGDSFEITSAMGSATIKIN